MRAFAAVPLPTVIANRLTGFLLESDPVRVLVVIVGVGVGVGVVVVPPPSDPPPVPPPEPDPPVRNTLFATFQWVSR